MRTSTRRAAQLAAAVLAGAGALAATSASASALPPSMTAVRASSTVSSIPFDVGDLVLRDATIHLPPIFCCGNLGPVCTELEQAYTTGAR